MVLFAVNPIIGVSINGKELIAIQIIVNFVIAILIFADHTYTINTMTFRL